MELIQIIGVCIAVFLALRVLYIQFFSSKNSNDSCGNGGCCD